jgi:phenylpyruvate tautomerase PptA (4-oxalocrotonate tautomerase family)
MSPCKALDRQLVCYSLTVYDHIEFIQDRSARSGRNVRLGQPSSLGELMPLFTVTMKAGRATDEKNAISRAIHEASVKAGYPEHDMFQRFLCLEQADLKVDLNYPGLPKPRTDKMLMIEVLVSSGTDAGRKTSLLAALVEALGGAGTDPNDIKVFFGEIDRANSSFGGGRLAPSQASNHSTVAVAGVVGLFEASTRCRRLQTEFTCSI